MTDDGGPAYPTIMAGTQYHQAGMSLRDYFAGQALVGATVGRMLVIATSGAAGMSDKDVADVAGSVADAMLAERKKCPPHPA